MVLQIGGPLRTAAGPFISTWTLPLQSHAVVTLQNLVCPGLSETVWMAACLSPKPVVVGQNQWSLHRCVRTLLIPRPSGVLVLTCELRTLQVLLFTQ